MPVERGASVRTIYIGMTVIIPTDATDAQTEEWVKYELGYSGEISVKNPLSDYDIEAKNISIV